MTCPKCGHDKFTADNTRTTEEGVMRYRECRECGYRFKTIEFPARKYEELMAENQKYRTLLAGLADALHHATK